MNANNDILNFFSTEEIPYIGTQPHTSKHHTSHSIFPRIFRRVLDILGCTQLDVYKEIQAAFVPPITNFAFSYEEGLLRPSLRAQVAESLTGLQVNKGPGALKIIATDSAEIEGLWALVPRYRRVMTFNGNRDSVCADSDHDDIWNHQGNPTIFVNTMLDSLLARTNISEEERLHLLLKGFAIAIHELGHLLHRYIHHAAAKYTPENFHPSAFSSQSVSNGRSEGGECVEEIAFGGRFDIMIDTRLGVTPCASTSHGYRLVGYTRKSNVPVLCTNDRVSKVVALLTSPLAIQPPGPPLPPFPFFAHPHHVSNVIALNEPKYIELSPEPGSSLELQLASISIAEVEYGTPSSPNDAAQFGPATQGHGLGSSVVCALPMRGFVVQP